VNGGVAAGGFRYGFCVQAGKRAGALRLYRLPSLSDTVASSTYKSPSVEQRRPSEADLAVLHCRMRIQYMLAISHTQQCGESVALVTTSRSVTVGDFVESNQGKVTI
jgi:hypothetical protein